MNPPMGQPQSADSAGEPMRVGYRIYWSVLFVIALLGIPRHVWAADPTYVPLDSNVYVLFDRLVSLGVLQDAASSTRPWTRGECARLIDAAAIRSSEHQAHEILEAIRRELGISTDSPARWMVVDRPYVRLSHITGPVLNDGYHFGQGITNDFGRPYGTGINTVAGVGVHGKARATGYGLRIELQQARAPYQYDNQLRSVLAQIDRNPTGPQNQGAVVRGRVLEAYVSTEITNLQISFGKQNLWWGPSRSGSLLLTNNAEPLTMFRVSRLQPLLLPWKFGLFGPWRAEFFIGALDGHQYPKDPLIHGQRISVQPTPNLEIGFSRTVVFGGRGFPLLSSRPLTFGNFWKSFASFGDHSGVQAGTESDAGDRRGGFDLRYRVPFLRNRLTVFCEGMTDDDPSPLASPHRSALLAGVHIATMPFLQKADLHLEYIDTDRGAVSGYRGTFFYFNGAYHSSHTNNGNLLGSWVGRQGRGFTAASTYWMSPEKRITTAYRDARVSGRFLEGGARIRDVIVEAEIPARHVVLRPRLQIENWSAPLLRKSNQRVASVGLNIAYGR